MPDNAHILALRKQTRDLYVALNKLANDALAFYARCPEKLSSRLLKELHSITNSVSKTLEKTPEVILNTTNRAVEMRKIDQEFELMREMDLFFLKAGYRECSNPNCGISSPPINGVCPYCGFQQIPHDKATYELEIWQAREGRIRELDARIAVETRSAGSILPEEAFPDPESLGLAGQVKNLLTIVDAKLKEARDNPMDALQSSMLREAVNILGSANGMIDRLESLSLPSMEETQCPPIPAVNPECKPNKRRKKPTEPKLKVEPVNFGELKIRS